MFSPPPSPSRSSPLNIKFFLRKPTEDQYNKTIYNQDNTTPLHTHTKKRRSKEKQELPKKVGTTNCNQTEAH